MSNLPTEGSPGFSRLLKWRLFALLQEKLQLSVSTGWFDDDDDDDNCSNGVGGRDKGYGQPQ